MFLSHTIIYDLINEIDKLIIIYRNKGPTRQISRHVLLKDIIRLKRIDKSIYQNYDASTNLVSVDLSVRDLTETVLDLIINIIRKLDKDLTKYSTYITYQLFINISYIYIVLEDIMAKEIHIERVPTKLPYKAMEDINIIRNPLFGARLINIYNSKTTNKNEFLTRLTSDLFLMQKILITIGMRLSLRERIGFMISVFLVKHASYIDNWICEYLKSGITPLELITEIYYRLYSGVGLMSEFLDGKPYNKKTDKALKKFSLSVVGYENLYHT